MAVFRPHANMIMELDSSRVRFMPHPLFPMDMDEVFVIEGGEAMVYQVQDVATGALGALKVVKPSYRGDHIVRSVAALAPYATLPGLYLGNRICLTRAEYPRLIAAYPDLEYAILMPWISGRSWSGLLLDRGAAVSYGAGQALDLTLTTAQALWNLEAHHLAHTDVAGNNLVFAADYGHVELLDIENLYAPDAPAPRYWSSGTPGYQHRNLGAYGNWCAEGDRFAAAILLAEMLAWCDPLVRERTPEGAESLFRPDELQELDVPRWQAMRDAIWAVCPPALALFDQAWASRDLAECPEIGAWALALLEARGTSGG
jgi:serine/threonine protein kinase